MAGATLPLGPDPFAGQTLGKYEVLCRLSTGGMSEIFLASQRGLAGFRKLLVIKSILPDIRGEEEFVRMFLDEAKITAAFNHPNIAQVFDLDIDDEQLFLVMEFVPGCTLVELARACRQVNEAIPTGLTLLAVRDTALALHYAHTFTDPLGHRQTVIHRDVAEKNIMLTYEGTTKLLDFGIAKSLNRVARTSVGMVKGTSGYMSPEQILGEPLDARSDLFSLGVVLHECLTGMRLFHGKDAEAGMLAALKDSVAPPSQLNPEVTPELDAVVLKALARHRNDRYGTTLEFARALDRAAGGMMWNPEQSGELVQRLFKDRRDQTRDLLEAAQESKRELTGEIRLANLLGDSVSPEPAATPSKPSPSLATPRKLESPSGKAPAEASPRTPPSSKKIAPDIPPVGPSGGRPAPDAALGSATKTPATRPAGTAVPEPTPGKGRPAPKPSPRIPSNPGIALPWTSGEIPRINEDDDEPAMLTIPAAALPEGLFDFPEPTRPGNPVLPPLTEETFRGSPPEDPSAETQPGVRRDDLTTERKPVASEPSSALPNPPPPVSQVASRKLPPRWAMAAVAVAACLALIVAFSWGDPDPKPLPVQPDPPKLTVTPPEPIEPTEPTEPPKAADPVPPVKIEAPPEPAKTVTKPEPEKPKVVVRPKVKPPVKPKPAPEKAATGQLTLVTNPWAKVLLKSQELGVTPLFKVSLPAGRHSLKLIGADGKQLQLPVEIKDGKVTAVQVSLKSLSAD